MKRIARDAIILCLVCGVFYLTARAVTTLSDPDEKPFTNDRMLADQYLLEKRWEDAAFHFAKLTERDPLNGHAWISQATCYLWIRNEMLDEENRLKESGASDSEIQIVSQKITETEDKLLVMLDETMKFHRYQKRGYINKAIILSRRKQWDAAMNELQHYLDGGEFIHRPLDHLLGLGRGGREMSGRDPEAEPRAMLHCFPRFWKLVDLEKEIRDGFEGLTTQARPL